MSSAVPQSFRGLALRFELLSPCSTKLQVNTVKESAPPPRQHLETADQETLLVSLSDKIHNARSILLDLRKPEIGTTVWARFKSPKEETLWYYRELANAFQRFLPGQLADELIEIVMVLENE